MMKLTIDQVYSLVEDIVLNKKPEEAQTLEIRTYYKTSELLRKNKSILIEFPNSEAYLISPEGRTERIS